MNPEPDAHHEELYRKLRAYKLDAKAREEDRRRRLRECLRVNDKSGAEDHATEVAHCINDWKFYNSMEKFFKGYVRGTQQSQNHDDVKRVFKRFEEERKNCEAFVTVVSAVVELDTTEIMMEESNWIASQSPDGEVNVSTSRNSTDFATSTTTSSSTSPSAAAAPEGEVNVSTYRNSTDFATSTTTSSSTSPSAAAAPEAEVNINASTNCADRATATTTSSSTTSRAAPPEKRPRRFQPARRAKKKK